MLQLLFSIFSLFSHPADVGGIILTAPPAHASPADVGGIILSHPAGTQKTTPSDVGGIIL